MRAAELRNTERELYQFHVRVGIAGLAVLVAFGLLAARFVFLQVAQHDAYRAKAEDNRISIVPVAPNRGLIVDRNGIVLARNFSAYTLEIFPRRLSDLERTIDELAEIVDIQPKDRARLRKLLAETRNAESLPIRTRLTDEEVAKFAANRYRFPGVDIKARLFRQYPFGETASHVIGYIGRINRDDQARLEEEGLDANYRGTEYIGKAGIEASYQNELHGTTGLEQVEIDAAGRGIRTLSRTPSQPGNDVALTLDIRLQEVAEAAFGARRGALVALEPSTGAVLAFVSKPGFDPNLFVDGIDPQSWAELNNSPDRPLNNRAIAGLYPPGSTFKPYMALAALELGKRTPRSTIFDPGYFEFGGRRFRDSKPGGHGVVDLYKSIVKSSDTYYYMLANDMGIDAIAGFMKHFGFGAKTGIDLQGEALGVLPSPEWKTRRFRRPEQQKWYAGETISIGIGQGYNSYTPVQLAQAIATLANSGVTFRPRLVSHVDNLRSGGRRYLEPQLAHRVPARAEHLEFVRNAMAGVNREGTGARAFAGAQYTSAGKTGTAQVIGLKQGEKYIESKVEERLRDHSLFIAFAPVESPKIALAVVVENSGFGARAAAPVARTVLDYFLLGKLPEIMTRPTPEDEVEEEEGD
ncbi:MAG: penicillin-binding protein 2 [Betaproteobacteria bacterium RIFCSPHIGHO2_12_FULL_69_13]|nr:MAG: penicillin-binding protein 2 [Betaproteobacteria bacterium RIFCSPHIGHO2_12_FULL_69_13]OGA67178.1 MAG: penicillin-binding protein 2 [Betaproteobacteria bacterium RIFCSPLOWO2_12_FULL_68_20]